MNTEPQLTTGNLTALAAAIVLSLTTYPPAARADTRTWSYNAKGYWSNPSNWDERIVPSSGDTLVFGEAGTFNGVLATNDLAPGTVFNSIVIRGLVPFMGFGVGFYGNALGLTGGIVASNLYQSARIYMDLTLQADQTFNCPKTTVYGDINLNGRKLTVASGTFAGVVQGTGSLEKTGADEVTLSGSSENTYAGATVVTGGSLWLNKSAGNAIPGALEISSATVQLLSADQIADTPPVSVNSDGILDLNNFAETIGPLTLSGGLIQTGSGLLTLNGNVQATSTTLGVRGDIEGRLSLGGVNRTFTIPTSRSVHVHATVSDGGLIVDGYGKLELFSANSFAGPVRVNLCNQLAVWHSGALGSTTAGTTVDNGGELELHDCAVPQESLLCILNTRLIAYGNCSWAGPVELRAIGALNQPVVEVHGTLDLSGPTEGILNLEGSGTVILSGDSPNTLDARVPAGVELHLNKQSNVRAISSYLDIRGTVRLLEDYQIGSTARVELGDTGRLILSEVAGEHIGSLAGSGTVELGSATLYVGVNDWEASFSGRITGASDSTLAKRGLATFTLSGASDVGNVDVGAGTLLVNGSLAPTSTTHVSSGATLGGVGTVGFVSVSGGGTLAPGLSPGVLTCAGVMLSSASTFQVELNSPSPGVGHDQLAVSGGVGLGGCRLEVLQNVVPSLGDQYVIINRSGTDPVLGTFTGLPEGAGWNRGGYQLQISYVGGTGNDVVLTVAEQKLDVAGTRVWGGNGNGVVDPNECDHLDITLLNKTTSAITGISAVVTNRSAGVKVTQPHSAYPDLPVDTTATNITSFQISTAPELPCVTNVALELCVTTVSHGSFVIPMVLPVGTRAVGPALRFDSQSANSHVSSIAVTGVTGLVARVEVSLWSTSMSAPHRVSLAAPSYDVVLLRQQDSPVPADYGLSCADSGQTTFSDSASQSIMDGSPPFVGVYRPEEALNRFAGTSGLQVNGTWTLWLSSPTYSAHFTNTIHCWSLFIYPYACADGGGACASCGGFMRSDSISPDDPWQNGSLLVWPVMTAARYRAYTLTNFGGPAEVTVRCDQWPDLARPPCTFSDTCVAAYLGTFQPSDILYNYLGSACLAGTWQSTPCQRESAFSFPVPAFSTFTVVVSQEVLGGSYDLRVTGFHCQPELEIERASTQEVRLHWSTDASGYVLESTPQLGPLQFQPVPEQPVVSEGRFVVTNTMGVPSRFYQLRRP